MEGEKIWNIKFKPPINFHDYRNEKTISLFKITNERERLFLGLIFVENPTDFKTILGQNKLISDH